MRVTAVLGSPHRGNGYAICKKIESELKNLGVDEFDIVSLKDVHLEMCRGCFTCFSKGGEFCPLKDDKQKIEKKLLDSDGIILISPGYVWNVSGMMKNFMDRFAYTLHRPVFFGQSVMLVANGGSGLKKVIKILGMCLGGGRISSKLIISATPWGETDSYREKTDRLIDIGSGKFFRDMSDKSIRKPNLGNVIWFQIFKKLSVLSKKQIPADYEFYASKNNYFYETNVNPLYTAVGKLIANVAVKSMKRNVKFY